MTHSLLTRKSGLARMSKKRKAQLSGHPVYSTLAGARKAIKPKRRKASETERIYGPEARSVWTKRQPCIVPGCGRTPCDAAHLINGGKGRKADARWTVPFCSTIVATGYVGHHDEYDDGKQSFMAKYFPGIERAELACAVEAAWQEYLNQRNAS